MTKEEYSKWYINFLITCIGPAVKREANNDPTLAADHALMLNYENKKNGLMLLSLVSIIENNFLTNQLRKLRNFISDDSIPDSINQTDLSCFIYIRDCFAHNPNGNLFENGNNTQNFEEAINNQSFKYAEINDSIIVINPDAIHVLHLIILKFFELNSMAQPQV